MENTNNNENALSLNINDLITATLTNMSELFRIQNERIVALEQKVEELSITVDQPTETDVALSDIEDLKEQVSDLADSVSDLDDKVDSLEDDVFNKVDEDDIDDKVADAIDNYDFTDLLQDAIARVIEDTDLQPQVNMALQNVLSSILSYNKD